MQARLVLDAATASTNADPAWLVVLQAAAAAAVIVAAATAIAAAIIARGAATVAEQSRATQEAAAAVTKGVTSMTLLLNYLDRWNSDRMLRYRAQLAIGLMKIRAQEATTLDEQERLARDEVGNLFDHVGFAVKTQLVDEGAAWEYLSAPWEVYWGELGDIQVDPSGDTTIWSNARFLLERFQEISAASGVGTVSPDEINDFLRAERSRAGLEAVILSGPPEVL